MSKPKPACWRVRDAWAEPPTRGHPRQPITNDVPLTTGARKSLAGREQPSLTKPHPDESNHQSTNRLVRKVSVPCLQPLSFGVVTFEIETQDRLTPDVVHLIAVYCHVKY